MLRLRTEPTFGQTQLFSQILPSERLQCTDLEVVPITNIVVTSDKVSFLGLREIYWPDVSEQQIQKWYDPFIPIVRKYDDIINNHIRLVDP